MGSGKTGSKTSRRARKGELAAAIALLLPAGLWGGAGELKVRIYAVHPPEQVRIAPGEGAEWSRCATCGWEKLSEPLVVEKHARLAKVAARGKVCEEIRVRGAWRLEVEGEKPVAGESPIRIRQRRKELEIVLAMELEEYVKSALRGESGGFRGMEAQKAMAVVARTFAVGQRGKRHPGSDYDFCDTTHCQDIRLGEAGAQVRQAVEATVGELLWHKGALTTPFYHAHCGGTLEAAGNVWEHTRALYLRVQQDPWCRSAGRRPWKTKLKLGDVVAGLRAHLRQEPGAAAPAAVSLLEVTVRSESGRVRQLRMSGPSGAMTVSAENLRLAVGRALGWGKIPSDYYEVTVAGDEVVLAGYGAGHGVGLCQAGAEEMARRGKTYREILQFYFPGTQVGVNAQGHDWTLVAGERVEVLTTEPQKDAGLAGLADRLLEEVERATGLRARSRPQVRVYPSVEMFRDTIGEAGWVAGSTRGNRIHLQPARLLRERGVLASTLRHELAHVVVEEQAHPSLPVWFREGFVQHVLGAPAQPVEKAWTPERMERALREAQSARQLREAYAQAARKVKQLEAEHSREALSGWLRSGLPRWLLAGGEDQPGKQ